MTKKRTARYLTLTLLFLALPLLSVDAQSGARGRGRSAPQEATLVVESNVSSAQITINSDRQGGGPPWEFDLRPGDYRVLVSADGYRTFGQNISLSAGDSITLDATLEPVTYDLNVDPGIGSAQIEIEGAGQGSGSLQVSLRPGTYTVRITAPGYQSFRTQVTIRGDQTLRPTLQPALASLRVRIPSEMIVGERDDMEDDLEIYVDGQRQDGIRFQVEPGQHVFRIVSGDWAAEGRFSVEAGNDYVLRPRLTLSLE